MLKIMPKQLNENMLASLKHLGRRIIFQNDNDPKHSTKDRRDSEEAKKIKLPDRLNMPLDLNLIEQMWNLLKLKTGKWHLPKTELKNCKNGKPFHALSISRLQMIGKIKEATPNIYFK